MPTVEEIDFHGTWTDKNESDLATLRSSIGKDPKALADGCRRAQNIVSHLIEELTSVRDTLSQTKAKELEQAVSHARTAAEAASLAATALFKAEPLPHIGSDPWQLMFQHAKEYSRLAYPDVEPPATRDGDLCVLCQQPLEKEAAARLRRFENYVAGKARKDAEKAATMLDEQSAVIKTLQVRSLVDVKSLLGEFTDMSDARAGTSAAVEKFVQAARKRQKKLLAAVESGDFLGIAELDGSVIEKLRAEKKHWRMKRLPLTV